ncbi:MAG: thioredoxin family protein [Planctomycetota bacterium]|jgi:small redox-active disulfide protein 2|nr:thioredoxin family protein [Planctomycetota bacterium]
MHIKILGSGCAKCKKLYQLTDSVAKECGIDYTIEKVEDINAIMDMGVMITPALAVDGEVKVAGKLPSAADIKKFIGK